MQSELLSSLQGEWVNTVAWCRRVFSDSAWTDVADRFFVSRVFPAVCKCVHELKGISLLSKPILAF